MVVRKMLEAWAGSRPTARKISGMDPPATAPRIMSQSSAPPMTAPTRWLPVNHQAPRKAVTAMNKPVTMPILPSRSTAIQAFFWSKRSVANWRIITARACWPVLPAWLATMGMSTASTAIWAMVPSNM